MKSILIHHHLGLGDHIICNGLVRFILDEYKLSRIYLPAKVQNYSTVSQMFEDRPEIVPVSVKNDEEVYALPELKLCDKVISVGFSKLRPDWDVSFYETIGLPFSIRWSKFKVARNIKREKTLISKISLEKDEPFVLIHNQGSVGKFDLSINTNMKKIYVEPLTDCMLDWCELAESAEEVHCIDSSFIHLAQSLNVKSGFFHNIRNVKDMSIYSKLFCINNLWKVIDYSTKG